MPTADTDTALRCEECGVAWVDVAERWRADLVYDEDDLHYWCPSCWLVEFGGD